MCVHFLSINSPQRLLHAFGVDAPPRTGLAADPMPMAQDIWPGTEAVFIRRPRTPQEGEREATWGRYGLIPHWAKDMSLGKKTYNARSETVAEKPSYRDAWRLGRRCIIPAEAFFEPDWRTGKAKTARISRADGEPMGIAGIWTGWRSPEGITVRSISMLTVNADHHALMNQYHRPEDEKRMVVILQEDQYAEWLATTPDEAYRMLGQYPAEQMQAMDVPPVPA